MDASIETEARRRASTEEPASSGARSRIVPVTLLIAALLGFLLPFATVSCGTPVTFTGLELATASVPSDGTDEREFADLIESNGTLVAAIGLGAIAIGLALVAAGLGGWGVAAATGLLALLLLPWLAALAEFEVHTGYVLSVGSLVVAAGIRRVDSVERRRAQGRRVWPAVLVGLALATPLVLTLIYLVSSDTAV